MVFLGFGGASVLCEIKLWFELKTYTAAEEELETLLVTHACKIILHSFLSLYLTSNYNPNLFVTFIPVTLLLEAADTVFLEILDPSVVILKDKQMPYKETPRAST